MTPDTHTPPLALLNSRVVTPFRMAETQCIVISDGQVSQMAARSGISIPPGAEVLDLEGRLVAPGFVDLHIHGADGSSFNWADDRQIDSILDYAIKHGTTRMLATLYLDEESHFLETIARLADYAQRGRRYSVLQGIHLEGPFINRALKGAMNDRFIWEPTMENWRTLQKQGNGFIRMMTIAPELPGALQIMQAAAHERVVLAIAHSRAKYEDIEVAIDNGLSQVTHMFNAMDPMHHRTPGIVTAALLKRELKLHLIADGVHVHPAVMALLYKLKGASGIILITDAISAAGKEDGAYDLAGQTVTVRQGKAYLDPDTLAGSTLSMEKAVKTMVEKVSIPLHEAFRMATLNPARVLGVDHAKGIVAVGKDADLIVLNEDFGVAMTIIGGHIAHRTI